MTPADLLRVAGWAGLALAASVVLLAFLIGWGSARAGTQSDQNQEQP